MNAAAGMSFPEPPLGPWNQHLVALSQKDLGESFVMAPP